MKKTTNKKGFTQKVKTMNKNFEKVNHNKVTVVSVGLGTAVIGGVFAHGINKITKAIKKSTDTTCNAVKQYTTEMSDILVAQGTEHGKDIAEVYKSVDVTSKDIIDSVAGVGAAVERMANNGGKENEK